MITTPASSQAGLASFRTPYDAAVIRARAILGPVNYGDPEWDTYQRLIGEFMDDQTHEPNEQEQER